MFIYLFMNLYVYVIWCRKNLREKGQPQELTQNTINIQTLVLAEPKSQPNTTKLQALSSRITNHKPNTTKQSLRSLHNPKVHNFKVKDLNSPQDNEQLKKNKKG